MSLTVEELDRLPPADAADALRACCGASAWVERMVARRPFETLGELLRASDEVCGELSPTDWLEAFAHHPRIGETKAAAATAASAQRWSAAEQAGAAASAADVKDALAEANRAYEARFGFIFIICASGLNAADVLAALRERLHNDPETELRGAAEQQRQITRLRLEKLVAAEVGDRDATSSRSGTRA